jgi:hypothetical protein
MATKQSVIDYTKSGTVLEPSNGDAVTGNNFVNDGHTWLFLSNTSGTPVTVIVPVTATVDDDISGLPPRQGTVQPNQTLILGPFTTNLYNDANGNASFTLSSAIQISLVSF